MSYPSDGGDVFRARVEGRIVSSRDPRSPGPGNSSDARRYPEPPDPPDRRAQWDEIRGVWEVWDQTREQWVEIGTPLAGDDVGMAGSRGAAGVVVGAEDVGLRSPVLRSDDRAPEVGASQASTETPQAGSGEPPLPPGADVDDRSAAARAADAEEPPAGSRRRHGRSEGRTAERTMAQPEPELLFPQPPHRPDPGAQWDPVEGIWRVWDPERADWVAW